MAVIRGDKDDNKIKGKKDEDDEIDGRGGDDTIDGLAGDDRIFGGKGDDELRGAIGDDILNGGAGDDVLFGGKGDDIMTGGRGEDVFNFAVDFQSFAGQDLITDFEQGRDKINLDDFGFFDLLDTSGNGVLTNFDDFVTVSGKTTIIDVGAAFGFAAGQEILTIKSTTATFLTERDFLFDPV